MTEQKPYVEKEAGDLIRAEDWNEVQKETRAEIGEHTHTGQIVSEGGDERFDGTQIPTGGLEDSAVTEAKLADGSVIESKLAAEAVSERALGYGAVTSDKLADGTVTASKLTPDSVEENTLLAGAVTNEKIAEGTINESKFDHATRTKLTETEGIFAAQEGAPEEALYIDVLGNIGIGTNDPQAQLQVTSKSDEDEYPTIMIGDNGTLVARKEGGKDNNAVWLTSNVIPPDGHHFTEGKAAQIALDNGEFSFSNFDPKERYIEQKFKIDYAGNVGIGTNDPKGQLHVTHKTKPFAKIMIGDCGALVARREGGIGNADNAVVLTSNNNPEDDSRFTNGKAAQITLSDGELSFSTGEAEEPKKMTEKVNIDIDGKIFANNIGVPPGDYAEYFESLNGKAISPGYSVVLEGGKVRRARKNEIPFGIISANPGIIGGVHIEWPGKYMRDDFGKSEMEKIKVETMEGSGKFKTVERPKLNPIYDENQEYIPRQDRPEWNCVGLLGQLPLRKGQPVADSWVKIKDISEKVELWLVK